MSQTVAGRSRVSGDGGRARAARVGALVGVLAMALVVYGTYGDPQAPDSQKSAVPGILVAVAVVAIVMFAVLAPLALRAVEAGTAGGRRWAIALATVSVLGLAIFWSGLPLIAGGAAALVGRTGRQGAQSSRAYSTAWVLGLFAAVVSILVTVVGNVVH